MKLTKADYMRLPKERLAELLAEMDLVNAIPSVSIPSVSIPSFSTPDYMNPQFTATAESTND